ncbi:tetratricopeptide repeat protein, partial [Gleimia sp. 6138-11-ORH1]|uniref:tetratricopeptide repeat protein n=1 Tax=Gleimia sp. 6138-11-ORH1 TaxID=2973937 RepID=UPI002169489C
MNISKKQMKEITTIFLELFSPYLAAAVKLYSIASNIVPGTDSKSEKKLKQALESKVEDRLKSLKELHNTPLDELKSICRNVSEAFNRYINEFFSNPQNTEIDIAKNYDLFLTNFKEYAKKERVSHSKKSYPLFDRLVVLTIEIYFDLIKHKDSFVPEGITALLSSSQKTDEFLNTNFQQINDKQDRMLEALSGKGKFSHPIHLLANRIPEAKDSIERERFRSLKKQIFDDGKDGVWVLKGMRGSGKSQIASALVSAALEKDWAVVVWQKDPSVLSLHSMYREIAGLLEIPTENVSDDELSQTVQNRLASNPNLGDCLFVFDDLKTTEDLSGLIPSFQKARVIITTNSVSLEIAEELIIDGFSVAEAKEYLNKRLKGKDSNDYAELASKLSYLPVALSQACHTMKKHKRDIRKYLSALKQYELNRAIKCPAGANYTTHVVTALLQAVESTLLTLNQEEKSNAEEQLSALCFLAESGVPRKWFEECAEDELCSLDTLGALEDYSLIQSTDEDLVFLHSLQSRVLRENPSLFAKGDPIIRIESAVKLLTTNIERMISQFDEAEKPLKENMRNSLRQDYKQLLEQLKVIYDQDFSKNIIKSTEVIDLIPSMLSRASKMNLDSEICALDTFILGIDLDKEKSIQIKDTLGLASLNMGRVNEAITLFEENLVARKGMLDENHRHTLANWNNLATAYQEAGRLDDTISLHVENLEASLHILRENLSDTLTSRNNLASAYKKSGRLKEAISLHVENLKASLHVLGENHP